MLIKFYAQSYALDNHTKLLGKNTSKSKVFKVNK